MASRRLQIAYAGYAYVNNELFFIWLKDYFFPRKPAEKVVFILDGHSTHSFFFEAIEIAEKNDRILSSFVFRPLKLVASSLWIGRFQVAQSSLL
jgi:hypothetical protein